MAITPNYSWPLPDDTSLVKDGAEAIRDLGNAIDTTVDGLPSGGLVHIKQETGTTVSAISVNDCFTADFDIYKILFNYVASTSGALNLRVREAGSDLSASNYNLQRLSANGSSVIAAQLTNQTSLLVGDIRAFQQTIEIEIANVFKTTVTNIKSTQLDYSLGSVTNPKVNIHFGNVNNATSFTGLSLLAGSGTFIGVIDVYGYKLG